MSEQGPAPDGARIMAAIDATWPPAEMAVSGPFRLRRGARGGKRVSAASAGGADADRHDIADAEVAMAAWGQRPTFRLMAEDAALADRLGTLGYGIVDPTVLYAAPVAALSGTGGHVAAAYRAEFPPAVMCEIWDEGGVDAARRSVMSRAAPPACYLMSRAGDRPAGAAFVGLDGNIAMIHAIEVRRRFRRHGCARLLIEAASRFAAHHGATWMTLAVTEANGPARALYEKLGMRVAGCYFYRVAREAGT